jgi:hypothetical protein
MKVYFLNIGDRLYNWGINDTIPLCGRSWMRPGNPFCNWHGFARFLFKIYSMNVSNTPDTMTSPSQVLEKLRQQKFDNEFHWTPDGFTIGKGKNYQPDELEIVKVFRFEGESNPSDSEILYVIRANDGLTGYSQDAYGADSSHDDEAGYDNFIRQIPQTGHDQQLLFEL